jgi:hypothetical protein
LSIPTIDKDIHKSKAQLGLSSIYYWAGKLPNDYELQGKTMAQKCAYLIKVHNNLQELVVNTDQTRIRLVPTSGAKTWKTKGSK